MEFKREQIRRVLTRSLLGVIIAATATLAGSLEASARSLFVSPTGDGSDGHNWKAAWKDPAQIDWTTVASGDQIIIDGGTSGIKYVTSFTVPVSNVVIRQVAEAGHNGQVIFNGAVPQYPKTTGIKFVGSNIHLVASRRGGIRIEQYGAECINIQTSNNSVRNVEMAYVIGFPPYAGGRIAGATFGGANNHFIACDFRDCGIGALEKPVAGVANSTVFNNCTFGANGYGFFANCGTGVQGSKTAGGPASTIYIYNSVLGPYVDYGVDIANGTAHLKNNLFLSARLANIKVTPAAGSNAVVNAVNCTLYEKAIDPRQQSQFGTPEYTISVNANAKLKIKDSIVRGGFVDVPPAQVINGGGNVQFAVAGNTTALAPSLADPNFVDNASISVMSAPSAFIPRTLTSLNFSVAPASAAVGKGSTFVRVSDLVAPYGPTTGLPSAIGGP